MTHNPSRFLKGLRYGLRSRLACHEWTYLFLAGLKRNDGQGQTRVDKNTDLVIESFPRSGNTFAVEAFTRSQPHPVRVAHHFHAPAQILRAARLGIPALAIIRPPMEAVLSFVIREPDVTIRQGLEAWLMFYETLLRHPGGYVLATFDQVTTDFGAVIKHLNSTFGSEFTPFEHRDETVAACFDAIDARNAKRFGAGHTQEERVARPSKIRGKMKTALIVEYSHYPDLNRRALVVYEQLVSKIDSDIAPPWAENQEGKKFPGL